MYTKTQPDHNNHYTIYCGVCNLPANIHPIKSEFVECERDVLEIGFLDVTVEDNRSTITDYVEWNSSNPNAPTKGCYEFLQDPQGPPAKEYDRNNEDDYVSVDYELNALEHWSDKSPEVYTSATSWWYINSEGVRTEGTYTPEHIQAKGNTPEFQPESRNVYIEGHEGFLSIKLLDYLLVEKHQNRLLNIFVDQLTSHLRVGGIRIVPNVDGTVTARCVKNGCQGRLTVSLDIEREQMEEFVLAVITHGNNHSADWFTKRDTFYKMHLSNCDINKCDSSSPICSFTVQPSVETTNA